MARAKRMQDGSTDAALTEGELEVWRTGSRELALPSIRLHRGSPLDEFECGLVTDKREWTETVTWRESVYESVVNPFSGTTTQRLCSVSTRSRTEAHVRYALRTPDGRETSRHHVDRHLEAELGQVMGTVDRGKSHVLYCNHTTCELSIEPGGLHAALGFPAGRVWVVATVLSVVGFFAVNRWLVGDTIQEVNPAMRGATGCWLIVTMLLSLITVGVVNYVVEGIRARQFDRRWAPQIRKFVEDRRSRLEQCFPSSERDRGVTSRS